MNTSSISNISNEKISHDSQSDTLPSGIPEQAMKTSFLVLQNNKYRIIRTADIAYFYTKHANSIIVCFDKVEYFVNYSLDRIQVMLGEKMYFRANRQYLINFSAIEEVEHYFARKLLVFLSVPVPDKLIIPKEKSPGFLAWLENR